MRVCTNSWRSSNQTPSRGIVGMLPVLVVNVMVSLSYALYTGLYGHLLSPLRPFRQARRLRPSQAI